MLNPAFKNELSLLRKSLKLINKPRHADTSGLLHSFKEPSLAMRPNRTHPVVRSLTARWEVCKHCTSWNIPKQRGSDDISLPSTSQFHNCTKCLVYASFSTHFVVYRLFFKAPRRRIFTFTDYTFPAPTLSSSLWGSERLVLDQLISYRRSPPSCQSQPWCSGYGCFHTHILFFPLWAAFAWRMHHQDRTVCRSCLSAVKRAWPRASRAAFSVGESFMHHVASWFCLRRGSLL